MTKIMIISVGKIFGGIEKYTMDIVHNLTPEEYQVTLVVREDGELIRRLSSENIIPISLNKKNILSSMRKINKLVNEKNIDVVHCNSNNAMFVALLVDSKKKIAVIHGDVLRDQSAKGKSISRVYAWLESFLANSCAMCIAVSHSMLDILKSRGVNNARVVHNGIHFREYDQYPDYYMKQLRICCVGNLLPVKNHIVLLKAIRELKIKFPDISIALDIYGEGPCREKLQNFILENELTGIVELKGFAQNVRDELLRYPVYVQPSQYESLGIAVLEAMNAGCCVIVSHTGGLMEIVDDSCGIHIDVNDYEMLAAELYRCYINRNLVERLGKEGKSYVKSHYTLEKMMQNTERCYREIKNENKHK